MNNSCVIGAESIVQQSNERVRTRERKHIASEDEKTKIEEKAKEEIQIP